ncbi:MAG: KTSC domain-containing protein, partial [Paludibacter sp.]|nr:KTSC domain-containing protein [Paludibacter sp.]
GYDLKNKRLEIEFLTFEVYQYKNVSPEHYITLMNPPEKSSHGIFFSSHIRDRYDYRKCPNKDWIKATKSVIKIEKV